jgi:hypothetical protein
MISSSASPQNLAHSVGTKRRSSSSVHHEGPIFEPQSEELLTLRSNIFDLSIDEEHEIEFTGVFCSRSISKLKQVQRIQKTVQESPRVSHLNQIPGLHEARDVSLLRARTVDDVTEIKDRSVVVPGGLKSTQIIDNMSFDSVNPDYTISSYDT